MFFIKKICSNELVMECRASRKKYWYTKVECYWQTILYHSFHSCITYRKITFQWKGLFQPSNCKHWQFVFVINEIWSIKRWLVSMGYKLHLKNNETEVKSVKLIFYFHSMRKFDNRKKLYETNKNAYNNISNRKNNFYYLWREVFLEKNPFLVKTRTCHFDLLIYIKAFITLNKKYR